MTPAHLAQATDLPLPAFKTQLWARCPCRPTLPSGLLLSASSREDHLSAVRTAEQAVTSSSAGTRTLVIFRFLPGLQHLAQRPVCEKNSINVHGINFPIKKRASAGAARERTDRSTLSPPPPPSMCLTAAGSLATAKGPARWYPLGEKGSKTQRPLG